MPFHSAATPDPHSPQPLAEIIGGFHAFSCWAQMYLQNSPQRTLGSHSQLSDLVFQVNFLSRPIPFDKCCGYNASTSCKFTYENNHTNNIPLFYPQPDDQRKGQMFCWNTEIPLKLKERSTTAWQIQVKMLYMPLIGWMTLRRITWSLWD